MTLVESLNLIRLSTEFVSTVTLVFSYSVAVKVVPKSDTPVVPGTPYPVRVVVIIREMVSPI